MTNGAVVLLSMTAAALMLARRQWAPLPFLVGSLYLSSYISVELGAFHFTALRVLIAIGALRAISRREWPKGPLNGLDRAMLIWAAWMLASTPFHAPPVSALVYRLGLVYDTCGAYFLFRSFCRSEEDVASVARMIAIALLPLAVAMIYEKSTGNNALSFLGGVYEVADTRDGKVRASGPFGHAILAGTAGATCLPLMLALRRLQSRFALTGIAACTAMIYCSTSSGPILSTVASLFALFVWRFRDRVRRLQVLAAVAYATLALVMNDPPYFLMARIDLTGGSTGWYRARLIQSAFQHLPEWWIGGTDYTRDWMWVVMRHDPNNTDITSHYIQMGVWGGLPLLFLFVFVLLRGFAGVGEVMAQQRRSIRGSSYMVWALGAALFAHAVTFVSVSYFDQSVVLPYVVLAMIGSVWSHEVLASRRARSLPLQMPAPRGRAPAITTTVRAGK